MPKRGHASGNRDVVHHLLVLLVVLVVFVCNDNLIGQKSASRLQHTGHLLDGGIEVSRILQRVDAENFVERAIGEHVHVVIVTLYHFALTLKTRLFYSGSAAFDLFISHSKTCDVCARNLRNLPTDLTEATTKFQDLISGLCIEVLASCVMELVMALLTAEPFSHWHKVPKWSTTNCNDIGHQTIVITYARNIVTSLVALQQCLSVAPKE
mmetsp:Transcript_5994/g.9757  ORF Transcript_5994/g.9757 Transcript_5994/m.9757 type:complete len:210 (-) Transcript_5994:429-1058(-)